MRRLVALRRTSRGGPEQYEGETEDGYSIFARERSGWGRIELDDVMIWDGPTDDMLSVLAMCFELPDVIVDV